MLPSRPLTDPGGKPLGRHLHHLGQNLDHLGDRLRQAAAQAVGGAVADVVRDGLLTALTGLTAREPTPGPAWSDPPSRDWEDPDDSEPYCDPSREAGGFRFDDPEDDPYDLPPEGDDAFPGRSQLEEPLREAHWRLALAAGLQAAAWWLRRGGRPALPSALAVGLTAALATLVGQRVGATGLVESGLALALLAGLVRLAGALLGPSPAT